MKLVFKRTPTGFIEITSPEKDPMLASFVGGDTGHRPASVEYWISLIENARSDTANNQLVGEGYTLAVQGDQTLFQSNYDLFPEAFYHTNVVLDALHQYRDWLHENAPS